MKKRVKRILCLLLAAVMLLGLAACGEREGAPGGKDAAGGGRDTTKATIAFSSEPVSMSVWDNEEMAPIYSAYLTNSFLMKIEPETMEAVCDLAESYEAVSDSEYVFHLRKGVKFHHGKEVKAEDVVATYEKIIQYPGSSPYVSAIVSVEAADDYTVRFTMNGPYPNLIYDLGYKYWFIYPADLIESGHDFASEPVGTGPFKMSEWSQGDYIIYERFDGYWDRSEERSCRERV